ncbi:MAG: hypothetical protein RLN72_16675 [Henriciella sp.]
MNAQATTEHLDAKLEDSEIPEALRFNQADALCVFHPNTSKKSGKFPAQLSEHDLEKPFAKFQTTLGAFREAHGNIRVPHGAALIIVFDQSCTEYCRFEIAMSRSLAFQSFYGCKDF